MEGKQTVEWSGEESNMTKPKWETEPLTLGTYAAPNPLSEY